MISRKSLMRQERKLIRKCKDTIYIQTANGVIKIRHEIELALAELGGEKVVLLIVENSPSVLSLGSLCSEEGYTYEWNGTQTPILTKLDGTKYEQE